MRKNVLVSILAMTSATPLTALANANLDNIKADESSWGIESSTTVGIENGLLVSTDGTPVSNKAHNVFALVRYIVTLIAGVAAVVLFIIIDGYNPGLYIYVAFVLMLAELILAIARTVTDGKRVAEGKLPVEDGKTVNLFEDDEDFAPVAEEYAAPVVIRDVPPPVGASSEQGSSSQTEEVIPPIAPVVVNQPSETEATAQPAQTPSKEPEQLTMLEPEKKARDKNGEEA